MKLELATDAGGLPLDMAVAGADVSEQTSLMPTLDDIPLESPEGTPVIAHRGHNRDGLRDEVEAEGLVPVIRHGRNRVRPSRNDGP